MTSSEMLDFLICTLLLEGSQPEPSSLFLQVDEKKKLFRSLVNVRPATPIGNDFIKIQDEYLQQEIASRGIVNAKDLSPSRKSTSLYLWQGDITTLKVDAIVNAANSALLGCFIPCHTCIDNAIHTYAGVQLRLACNDLMKKQATSEPAGSAKITPAFNLPSKHVLHTVGPIISGRLGQSDCELLASCYRSCLKLATQHKLESIAFCCISTGEFHFPQYRAAEIAVSTVEEYLKEYPQHLKVIFNVYKESDYEIYRQLLQTD